MSRIRNLLAAFSLTVIAVLIAAGCASSSDDASSGQAAAQVGESGFQLEAAFTEIRPKVRIENKHTCHGENLSPPLSWNNAPADTVSYALVAEDLDHRAGSWVQWILYNIPGGVTELPEGISTSTSELPDGTIQGSNDHKTIGYEGPCPIQVVIRGEGEGYGDFQKTDQEDKAAHKYRFTIYALGAELSLAAGARKSELVKAMKGHILAEAVRDGKFQLPVVTQMSEAFNKDAMGCGSTCEAAKTAEAALTATASE